MILQEVIDVLKEKREETKDISFENLISLLVQTCSSWEEYTKGVLATEHNEASPNVLDKVYRSYLEHDYLELVNPELSELIGQFELEEE